MTNYIFPSLPLILVLHLLYRNYRLKKQLNAAKSRDYLSVSAADLWTALNFHQMKNYQPPKSQMDELIKETVISDFARVITKNPITQEESAALSATLSDRPKGESITVSEPPPPELVNVPKSKKRNKRLEGARKELQTAAGKGEGVVINLKKKL